MAASTKLELRIAVAVEASTELLTTACARADAVLISPPPRRADVSGLMQAEQLDPQEAKQLELTATADSSTAATLTEVAAVPTARARADADAFVTPTAPTREDVSELTHAVQFDTHAAKHGALELITARVLTAAVAEPAKNACAKLPAVALANPLAASEVASAPTQPEQLNPQTAKHCEFALTDAATAPLRPAEEALPTNFASTAAEEFVRPALIKLEVNEFTHAVQFAPTQREKH